MAAQSVDTTITDPLMFVPLRVGPAMCIEDVQMVAAAAVELVALRRKVAELEREIERIEQEYIWEQDRMEFEGGRDGL